MGFGKLIKKHCQLRTCISISVCLIVILVQSKVVSSQTLKPSDVSRNDGNGPDFDGGESSERNPVVGGQSKTGFEYFVIFYIIGAIYSLVGLYILCKFFFVPSLHVIIQNLAIEEDVAGATFMAVATSFNTLPARCLALFVSGDDQSLLTSVTGTSLFNILFIVGLCGFAHKSASTSVNLRNCCWPLLRDSFFLLIALLMLLFCGRDALISWYESFVLLALYVLYLLVMKFDGKIGDLAGRLFPNCMSNSATGNGAEPEVNCEERSSQCGTTDLNHGESDVARSEECEGLSITCQQDTRVIQVANIIFFPVIILLYYTLPNVHTTRGRRFNTWAYLGSILWMTIFSEFMFLSIGSDPNWGTSLTMGARVLTIAFESSPILISSLILAREGKCSMIVHAALGSAIFVICVRTILPFLIYAVLHRQGLYIASRNERVMFSICLGMLVLFIASRVCFSGRMNKLFGSLLLIYYALFTCLLVLLEYGVITF